jgi:hypothetical protein
MLLLLLLLLLRASLVALACRNTCIRCCACARHVSVAAKPHPSSMLHLGSAANKLAYQWPSNRASRMAFRL